PDRGQPGPHRRPGSARHDRRRSSRLRVPGLAPARRGTPTGMFEGFTLDRIDVGDAVLRVRHGGAGPPVLLLHGHPRTHATWNKVALLLAERFTVVCSDLRGYGESSKPATTPDHAPYSKRAMAGDCV